jgi:DNA repair exonuclease SbcCD ATPase subunit
MHLTKRKQDILKTVYYKNHFLFGRDKLYQFIRERYPTEYPTRREVMDWLRTQKVWQLHNRPPPRQLTIPLTEKDVDKVKQVLEGVAIEILNLEKDLAKTQIQYTAAAKKIIVLSSKVSTPTEEKENVLLKQSFHNLTERHNELIFAGEAAVAADRAEITVRLEKVELERNELRAELDQAIARSAKLFSEVKEEIQTLRESLWVKEEEAKGYQEELGNESTKVKEATEGTRVVEKIAEDLKEELAKLQLERSEFEKDWSLENERKVSAIQDSEALLVKISVLEGEISSYKNTEKEHETRLSLYEKMAVDYESLKTESEIVARQRVSKNSNEEKLKHARIETLESKLQRSENDFTAYKSQVESQASVQKAKEKELESQYNIKENELEAKIHSYRHLENEHTSLVAVSEIKEKEHESRVHVLKIMEKKHESEISSYKNMAKDLEALKAKYETVGLQSIGKSSNEEK